jgi:hypothetical protein
VLSQAVPAVLMGTKNFKNRHNVANQKRNSWVFFGIDYHFIKLEAKNEIIFHVQQILFE